MQAIKIGVNRINTIYETPWIHATKNSVLTLFWQFKTTWINYRKRRTWCKIMLSNTVFHNLRSLILIWNLFNSSNYIKKLNLQLFSFLNNIFFVFQKLIGFERISFRNNRNNICKFRYLVQKNKFFIFGTMTIEEK